MKIVCVTSIIKQDYENYFKHFKHEYYIVCQRLIDIEHYNYYQYELIG